MWSMRTAQIWAAESQKLRESKIREVSKKNGIIMVSR